LTVKELTLYRTVRISIHFLSCVEIIPKPVYYEVYAEAEKSLPPLKNNPLQNNDKPL
jgi:hypothetical protein